MAASFTCAAVLSFAVAGLAVAQPQMLTSQLGVRTVVENLELPTSVAFLGENDFLVLEKNSGRVLRVTDGAVAGPVLDLAVNFFSERGLLGITLHPDFPENPGVYLFWTCRGAPPADRFFQTLLECADQPEFGEDTDDTLSVPLLANRVDRFEWNGSSLVFDHNLIKMRAFQNDGAPDPPNQGDGAQPARGNHDGGIIDFGPDGKLYVMFGDQGRRGQLQNLPSGPTLTGLGPEVPDDQFGGPEPDDAHLAGVILRLNDDGSTPTDNPFFAAGQTIGGEVGANVQRIFAYGIRNSFGMDFDPVSGALWYQDNGEDAFDELNRADAGLNSGWIQIAGPLDRLADYREIETTSLHAEDFPNLQQFRWGPERIATSEQEALSRLFVLPGSHYSDPEFAWKNVIAPAAIGFAAEGDGLGHSFSGDLFVRLSVPTPLGGPLLRMQLTGNRQKIATDDPRIADGVADNPTFFDLTESESFIVGRDFGVITDIEPAPNGNLYVTSLSNGAIYEVFRAVGRQAGRGRPGDATDPLLSVVRIAGSASAHSIRFTLGETSDVRLTIHDASGRRIAELLNGTSEVGDHELTWAAANPVPGMYFVRLENRSPANGAVVRSAKLVVLD